MTKTLKELKREYDVLSQRADHLCDVDKESDACREAKLKADLAYRALMRRIEEEELYLPPLKNLSDDEDYY